MRRLFAGVRVAVTAPLMELVAEGRREWHKERIRWVRPENLHLTLYFFGAMEEQRIPEIEPALARAAEGVAAFDLRFTGLGVFGPPRQPRVLWLGVESAELAALHARVEPALAAAGWPPEPRDFAPHLTLGRIGRVRNARRFRAWVTQLADAGISPQRVKELVLFESVSGRYVPLAEWPLIGTS